MIGIDHFPGQHRSLFHISEQCSACCYVIGHRRVRLVALGRYQFRLQAGNRVMMRIGDLKKLALFEIASGSGNKVYVWFRGRAPVGKFIAALKIDMGTTPRVC